MTKLVVSLLLLISINLSATQFEAAAKSVIGWMDQDDTQQAIILLEALIENEGSHPKLADLMRDVAFRFVWMGNIQAGADLYRWSGYFYHLHRRYSDAAFVYETARDLLGQLPEYQDLMETVARELAITRQYMQVDGPNLEIQEIIQQFQTLPGPTSQVASAFATSS